MNSKFFKYVNKYGYVNYINVDHVTCIDRTTVYLDGNQFTKFQHELSTEQLEELRKFMGLD